MNMQKFKSRSRLDSQIVIKKYREDFYRVYSFRSYPVKGLDIPSPVVNFDLDPEAVAEGSKSKLDNNLSRAKSKVFDYAISNDWDFFFTGTFNSDFIVRDDIDTIRIKLTQFIRNYNRLHNCSIKYLFVPEKHSDNKNWHLHGFISGIPSSDLHQFALGDKMSKYLSKKVKSGCSIFSWLSFQSRFGFCDLEPIIDPFKSSSYITKYITKNTSITSLGSHLYYCSKGLNHSFNIQVSDGCFSTSDADFYNDYIKVKSFYSKDDLSRFLVDNKIIILYN